jgi:hypothetical protein
MHMKSQSGSIRNLPGVMAPDHPLRRLGIVTRVTLDIQPAFEMRQDTFEGLR